MRRNRALRGLVVLALVVGAVLVAAAVWRAEQRSIERENDSLARRAAATVTRTVDVAAGSLRGSQGLLDFNGDMGRNRFQRFARGVLRNSALSSMTWIPRVVGSRRVAFVRNRLDGKPIVGIDPDGGVRSLERRKIYFPVEYVWPEDARRLSLIGVDVFSSPVRARAAKEARDTAESRATAPVTTVAAGEPGVTVFHPIYKPGAKRRNLPQRRSAIRGFVTGTLFLDSLTEQALQTLPADTEFQVLDGDAVLMDTGTEPDRGQVARAEVAGRSWEVRAYGAAEPSKAAAIAIGAGGILLALLAAIVFTLADRREARLEARRRGAELRSQRDALQARTADVLEGGLTVRERMGALARELVPAIADFCVVDVEAIGGGWERVAAAAADERLERELGLGRRVAGIPLGPNPGRAALLFGSEAESALTAGVDTGVDGELGVSSMIVLRLFARGRRVGLMLLGRLRRSGARDFTADDMQQLRELGNRAALALDSARLYERERATATTLQSHLLPVTLPEPRGLEIGAAYRAGGEGLQVGGDFYDFYAVPDGWVAAVGDVCGSGAEAASLTSLLRHTLRTGSRLSRPEHALALVDSAAREETDGTTFLTLAAAWLNDPAPGEPLRVRVAVAGHPEPRVIRNGGTVSRLAATGSLMGVLDDWQIDTLEVSVQPGETFLLFTDGLTEARHDGEIYGDDRLDQLLAELGGEPVETLLERIQEEVLAFAGGEIHDDLAILAVRPRAFSTARGGVARGPEDRQFA